MEGEAISATIEVLVQNLINVSRDEISLIRGLDENAEKLRRNFGMIQSFLDDAQTKVQSIGASFYGIEECSSNNGVYQETVTVFPALKKLKLRCLRNLREWEEVRIPSGADQVKVFPCLEYLSIQSFGKLMWYRIKDSYGTPNWNYRRIDKSDGLYSLNSLEKLTLEECDNLESIPYSSSINKFQVLTSLRSLTIYGCRRVANYLSEMEESCAPLLEHLKIIAGSSDVWDSASFNKAVDGVLRFRSHTLRTLNLSGKPDWESLPDQIQHLTSLSVLILRSFGIEELPEWIGNLSSLSQLQVWFCRKLKRLPSVEAMRRLTNLTTMEIYGCPILREEREIKKQSEWPKISHIPNITVDWRCIQST